MAILLVVLLRKALSHTKKSDTIRAQLTNGYNTMYTHISTSKRKRNSATEPDTDNSPEQAPEPESK